MPEDQGLRVRHAKRHDIALDAELRIAKEHEHSVRFSPASGARDEKLRVVIVDASSGGLGLISTVFIPRKCVVVVRAQDPTDPAKPVLLEARLRVQRSRMTDRRPAYFVGTSFVLDDEAQAAGVDRFLRLLDGEADADGAGAGAQSGA